MAVSRPEVPSECVSAVSSRQLRTRSSAAIVDSLAASVDKLDSADSGPIVLTDDRLDSTVDSRRLDPLIRRIDPYIGYYSANQLVKEIKKIVNKGKSKLGNR